MLLGSAATLPAVDVTWNGGTGEYNTGSNWSSNSTPGTNDNVTISSGTATWAGVTTGSGNFNRNGTGSVILNGTASLEIGTSYTYDNRLRLSGGGGTFTVADSASLVHKGSYFIIGGGGTTAGTLNQTGGTITVETQRGFFLSDGTSAAGSV